MAQIDELWQGEADLRARVDALVRYVGDLAGRAQDEAPDLAPDIAALHGMAQDLQAALPAQTPSEGGPPPAAPTA